MHKQSESPQTQVASRTEIFTTTARSPRRPATKASRAPTSTSTRSKRSRKVSRHLPRTDRRLPQPVRQPRTMTLHQPVPEEPLSLRRVRHHQLSSLSVDTVQVHVIRTGVHVSEDLPPLPLIPERQILRRLPVKLENIRRLRLKRRLRHTVLRRVPRIRVLHRPTTHTGRTTPLRLRNIPHLVRLRIQPRLILMRIRNRVTQPRQRRRRHRVNTVHIRVITVTSNPDETLTRLQQVLQRPKVDHRHQRPPHIINLVLRRRRQLNQRRRMTHPHRLTRVIIPTPTTRTPMISAVIRITNSSPTTELRRTHSLHRNIRRRIRRLAALLGRHNQRAAVHKRLIQRRLSRIPHCVLTDPVKIRCAPELPVILPERLAASVPVRNPAMLRHPSVNQIPKRREIDNTDTVTQHRRPQHATGAHDAAPQDEQQQPSQPPHPQQPANPSQPTQPSSNQPDPQTDATEPTTQPAPQHPHNAPTTAPTSPQSADATPPTATPTHSPAATAKPQPTTPTHAQTHKAVENPAPDRHNQPEGQSKPPHVDPTEQTPDQPQGRSDYEHRPNPQHTSS